MPLADLSADEVQVVGECLRAAAYGPFFPDWEFSSIFGLSRQEVQSIADRYPAVDEDDDGSGGSSDDWLAINNAVANLLGYPHGASPSTWSAYISVSPPELQSLFKRWSR